MRSGKPIGAPPRLSGVSPPSVALVPLLVRLTMALSLNDHGSSLNVTQFSCLSLSLDRLDITFAVDWALKTNLYTLSLSPILMRDNLEMNYFFS